MNFFSKSSSSKDRIPQKSHISCDFFHVSNSWFTLRAFAYQENQVTWGHEGEPGAETRGTWVARTRAWAVQSRGNKRFPKLH